ncbi:MAG: winged helix-turn-helix domain-containing protein [Methanolobus sp.]|nr:winged helix-turn-helix domain-containing protein [Methanolobus sp.]
MRKPLLDVLFASEKRKNTLLLLRDGPMEMKAILQFLDTTRQALLPQIRVLEDSYLVAKSDSDVYELSVIGKMLVGRFRSLLCTLEVLDTDITYWGEHHIDFIPSHLLNRICELDDCEVIEPDITEVYELNKDFMEQCLESRSICSVISFYHPDFASFYSECLPRGINVSIIISNELYEKVKANETQYKEFMNFLKRDDLEFYCYPHEMEFVAFSQNDHGFLFRLLTRSHQYDSKQLVCHGPRSAAWGYEFFEHIKQQSVPITDI